MELYKVTIRGGYSSTGINYNECYVVAKDPTKAYQKYRVFLDKEDICFNDDREMKTIELIADTERYGKCKMLLFLSKP